MSKFVLPIVVYVMCCAYLLGVSYSMEKLDKSDEETVAQEKTVDIIKEANHTVLGSTAADKTSNELVALSWEASSQGNLERLDELVSQCVTMYEKKARVLQEDLTVFPTIGQKEQFSELNNVGTCLFIKAEAVMSLGKSKEAMEQFEYIIQEYPWAQAWDPRGWFWSVAEKSQASIDVLTGKAEDDFVQRTEKIELIKPQIVTKGTSNIVDYTKYGEFQNVGQEKYFYRMHDPEGLSAAIGEGIYPNTSAIYDNPRYKIVNEEGRLEGSHWDFVSTHDLEAAYFKWATAREPWGVRLFYLGMVFEKAQMHFEALRAYHAIVVHFPKTVAWTYWQTPWYPGQAAIAKIRHIIRLHPDLDLDYKWMKIERIITTKNTGTIIGTVTLTNFFQLPAPSTSAAS